MFRRRWLSFAIAALCLIAARAANAGLLFNSGYTAYYFRPYNYSVDVGDVNGDGHPDIVSTVSGGPSYVVRVALGQGDGTFETFKDSPLAPGQDPIRLGDFNGDGKLDLLMGDAGLALGVGDGTFGPRMDLGAYGNDVIGDVNGDGKLDVILNETNQADFHVLLGNGNGTFAAPLNVATGGGLGNFVLMDANQDGKPDLVTGFQNVNAGTDLGVALGNGDGTFASVTHFGDYYGYADLFSDDLDGDGKPDVLTQDRCYFGDGAGGFGPAVSLDLYVYGISDFNGDGKPDLIGSSSTISGVYRTYTELGNGDGTFQVPVMVSASGDEDHFNFADFNGDGHLDYIGGSTGVGSMFVHLGHGDGAFGSRMSYATGLKPVALAVADLDGDGRPDVATANQTDATVSVLLGTGGGGLGPKADFAAGPSPLGVGVGDLNHDGRLDLVTASQTSASVSVLSNLGGGLFAAHVDYATGSATGGLGLGDFDEDGNLDVVTSDPALSKISLLRGDGLGGLAPEVGFSAGAKPYPITVGDLNGDGHLDVVTLAVDTFGNGMVSVLLGDGLGHFAAATTTLIADSQVRAIAVADLNHDGKADVVASSRINTQVCLGDGTGSLSASPFFRLIHLRGLALGDLDGDGNLDIAAASDLADCAWVTLGHGDGTFGILVYDGSTHWDFAPGYGTESYPNAVAIADMNGDGQRDLVLSEADPYNVFNGISVLLHVPSAAVAVPPIAHEAHLALDGLRPNPAVTDLIASFTLAERGPATLEMFDVSGRRVLSQSVGSLGPGAHLVRLQAARPLGAGIYFLRLTQNKESVVARATLMR